MVYNYKNYTYVIIELNMELQPSTTNLVVRYGDIKGFLIGSIEYFRTTIYVVL